MSCIANCRGPSARRSLLVSVTDTEGLTVGNELPLESLKSSIPTLSKNASSEQGMAVALVWSNSVMIATQH